MNVFYTFYINICIYVYCICVILSYEVYWAHKDDFDTSHAIIKLETFIKNACDSIHCNFVRIDIILAQVCGCKPWHIPHLDGEQGLEIQTRKKEPWKHWKGLLTIIRSSSYQFFLSLFFSISNLNKYKIKKVIK